MNTLLLIFLAPFLTSTAVGQVESVQIQSSFFETTALKFYCRYGSVLNEDVSGCTPKTVVQEQPQQTVQEKVVEVVRNVFVPVASAQEPSDSYLESMIRRIVLELLPQPQVITVKGEKGDKGDKGDPGTSGSNLLAFDGIQMPFWSGYGSGPSTSGGSTVINNNVNVTSNTLSYSTTTGLLTSDVGGVIGTTTILVTSSSAPSWLLAGNAGTNSATDFLGTTDAQDLVFRTNNVEQLRITQTGRLLAPNATDSIFIDGGNETMTGVSNIGIGDGAVGSNTTGISNIALGQNALLFNTTGFSNMAIGQATLLMNNGNTNTAIGQGAGIVSTGNSNTFIGYGAGNTQSAGDNNIVIGQLANTGNGIGSNQLSIGNWIYGDNGNIGIGQSLPTERLDVIGNIQFSGALMPNNLSGALGTVLISQGAGLAPVWVSTSTLSGTTTNVVSFATTTGIFTSTVNGVVSTTTIPSSSGAWLLTGNTGTNANINFLGTTDNVDLVFKTNNATSGRITNDGQSTAFGLNAGNNASRFNTFFVGSGAGDSATNADYSTFIGIDSGNGATNASYSNFFGENAGGSATNADSSNFFGSQAGSGATSAYNSNFFGNQAGLNASDANNSNFFGEVAGFNATNAGYSNFFGYEAGINAINANFSNFLGTSAGFNATNADNSNFFGSDAGMRATNASYSNFFGPQSGVDAVNATYSNFFSQSAGRRATNANNSNFFGHEAGQDATAASHSNFFGNNAGHFAINAEYSNFFSQNAGSFATNAYQSNFFGQSAGANASSANDSNFFGQSAGQNATNANNSNFFGQSAGSGATNASESIFIGTNAGLGDTVNNTATGTSILIGQNTGTGGFSNSIALGEGAVNTAVNQFYIRDAITNFNLAGVNYDFPTVQGATGTVLTNDGAGNLSWGVAATTSTSTLVSADNGLTVNPANNVQLGGRLLQNTSIETNDGFGGFFFEVGPNAGEPLFKVDTATNVATLGDADNWSGGTSIDVDISNRLLRFITADSGFLPQERMIIDGNGFVGINSPAPTERLDVSGNVRFSGALMPNNLAGATGTILISQGNGLAPIWTATSSLNLSVSSSTIASNFGFIQNGNSFGTTATLGTNDAFNLQFETNNSVRMALTQAGRLTFTNVPGNVFLGGGNDATTGVGNVGVGILALASNTTGQNNVANGYAALAANTTGYNNTANGGAALTSNTTGYNNTANGILAMQFNISGINNVANGASALRFNTGNNNVASGVQAGYNNTSGSDNVIMGMNSFMGNVTGSRNVAIGSSAMINNTSNNNTALGYQAGYSISSGSENTFLGYNTNTASGTIINATAVGANVMLAQSNTLILGNNVNVGIGTTTPTAKLSVQNNLASKNILQLQDAAGQSAPQILFTDSLGVETSRIYAKGTNMFMGYQAGQLNTTGNNNVFFGYLAGGSNTTGNYNIAIGSNAGGSLATGANNIFLGANTTVSNGGITNSVAIGYGVNVTASSTIILGTGQNVGINNASPLYLLHTGSSSIISGTTVARFQNAGGTCDVTPNVAGGITCTSDQTLKKDIEAIDPIDSLQKLLTVEIKSYRMNADTSTSTKQTGFLAQQLETQFPGLVLTSIEGTKSVSYAGMAPILTQAIQTLYRFMTDIGVTIEGGVAKVGEFVANKVKTDELCVGNVCVTESQFLQMVQDIPGYSNTTQTPSENSEDNTNTPADNTDPTTSEDISVDETSEQGESEQTGQSETPVLDTSSGADTQTDFCMVK